MRDARPVSFLRTSCSQSTSLRRWMMRCALTPQVYRSAFGNRSCEYGIRISTCQPSSPTVTADSQTASHDVSRKLSL